MIKDGARYIATLKGRGYCFVAPISRSNGRDDAPNAHELLAVRQPKAEASGTGNADAEAPTDWRPPCPCCGGRMIIIETFERGGGRARAPPWTRAS